MRLGFAALIFAGLTSFDAARADDMVVAPFGELQFPPTDPARPLGTQIAVLRGDLASGASDIGMRMERGDGVRHVHSADDRLVVLKGEMKHWHRVEERAAAKQLGPGSDWFQPGGQPHGDDCVADECPMFISWSGARDGRLAD